MRRLALGTALAACACQAPAKQGDTADDSSSSSGEPTSSDGTSDGTDTTDGGACTQDTHQGDLVVTDDTAVEDVACIREVTGSLRIEETQGLADLSMLAALRVVRGDVVVGDNAGLVGFDGLDGLETIEGMLDVSQNPVLEDMSMVASLTRVGGMDVTANPKLVSLPPLSGQVEVGFEFSIVGNGGLKHLDAFAEFTPIPVPADGWVQVQVGSEASLVSATGLGSFADLGDALILKIVAAPQLSELPVLGAQVRDLQLERLPAVTSLESFAALEKANEVTLSNLGISDLGGLDALTELTGSLTIGDCNPLDGETDALQSLVGLESLDAAFNVFVVGNAELTDVSALLGLQDAGNYLYVTDNPKLPGAQAQALADSLPDAEATLCGNMGEASCGECPPQG